MKHELVRAWDHDGFYLELYDTHRTQFGDGKSVLAYRFWDEQYEPRANGSPLFEGEDFCCSPLYAIDGDECVAALLTFLSLRPGDTDRDYFADYTPRQMEWCQSGRAEELDMLQYELREGE